jgi:DNA helicase II / ATP-dependent DNA helicase PcrA
MKFIADLHVHSKFSRATAKNLDLENMYIAAQLKGVTVVGTGDFTYPAWFSEICEKLEPAEEGLFKLKDELAKACDEQVPVSCRDVVRFILSTEISNIYKKNDKTRKNHNLVLVPDLAVAEKFSAKLDRIGNIKSDGRPILGLDARNLLEILLETSDQAFLIPAHIWTPWFSVLGSKSGFNSIKECFEDLNPYIFAAETGLSSDPPMNWRVSDLDELTLVSNSDAHSPLNLGREANLLNTRLSYHGIKSAIKSGDSDAFLGTFEFYPEEGKYHLDGHRNCKIRLNPRETMDFDGKCPVCGKALTIGVLNRVEELADRSQGLKPPSHCPYHSIIPLAEIFSDILRVGVKSKKVKTNYQKALTQLGSEFNILHTLETDKINSAGIPLLGEAIRRMRQKEVEIMPGYDGEYGRIKIFNSDERERLLGQKALFSAPRQNSAPQTASYSKAPSHLPKTTQLNLFKDHEVIDIFSQLNDEQRRAVEYPGGPLLIVAGPGTGKTRTLTHRIAYLMMKKKISAHRVLAVTFTNKAAQEMRARLMGLMGDTRSLPLVATFHSFCYQILNEQNEKPKGIIDDHHRGMLIAEAVAYVRKKGCRVSLKPKQILNHIIAAKQQILDPDEFEKINPADPHKIIITETYRTYQNMLAIQNLYDYEDLMFHVVRQFESGEDFCKKYQKQFQHVFVDEYQDLNQAQYRIIRALIPAGDTIKDLCVIGDPDQAIYSFRGSDVQYFNRFISDYPQTGVINLIRNYRSTKTILNASFQVIKNHRHPSSDERTYSQIDGAKVISIMETATEKTEAQTIAGVIEQQIGGTGFHSVDTGKVFDANSVMSRSYSDFAVLYRTNAQHRALEKVFERAGIPFQIASRETALNQKGLPEIISLLKAIEGHGGYLDYENVMRLLITGIGKKTLDPFKDWCYRNRFTLQQGLFQAARFPVPGLKPSRQQILNEFSRQLSQYKENISGLTVADKLLYLEKNTKLFGILNNDAKIKEAFVRLVEVAVNCGTDLIGFFSSIALHTDTDVYAQQAEKVSLMTIHAAKGLEFPVVFITGCEEDLIPLKQRNGEQADIEEERRLFYVAMTRAKDRLYLTRAKKRRIYGKIEAHVLSHFVADIENRLKQDDTPRLKKRKKKGPEQMQLKLF